MKSTLFALYLYFVFLCCSALGFGLAIIFWLVDQLHIQSASQLNVMAHTMIFGLPLKLMPIWNVEKSGRIQLNPKIIVVSNHLSLIDVALITPYFCRHNYRVVFVGRSGQDKIPLVGWSLKLLGHVFIEFKPGNKAVGNSVRIAMDELREIIARSEKVAVLFFATGLFQNPSEDPRGYQLKSGPFILAKEVNIDVVPVWLQGTNEALPLSNPFKVHRATLAIRTGAQIPCCNQSIEEFKCEYALQLRQLWLASQSRQTE